MGEFRMPALGADMEAGTLNEWLVKVGDEVHRGDVVAVVETPKSAVEVECFEGGTVQQLLVAEGEKVPVGTVLARLGQPGGGRSEPERTGPRIAAPSQQPVSAAPVAAAPVTAAPVTVSVPLVPLGAVPAPGPGIAATTTGPVSRRRVTPLARRLAAELGIDLAAVQGSGLGGAVRAEDVRRVGSVARPSDGQRRPADADLREKERDAEMRRSIAALMTLSNREIPHYHLGLAIDLHRVVDLVRTRNRQLEMADRLVASAFLLAATARAARAVPELNGHWVDGSFRPAPRVDLGLILSLRSGGLLVPVIPGADRLSPAETMAAMRELTRRARAGRLRGSDLAPPTISVSNLGDQGVDSVQGVIYPPQVALVGFGAVAQRPWAVDGLLGVRPIVTVTLAGDHRATDGATGSRFLKMIERLLQAPEEL